MKLSSLLKALTILGVLLFKIFKPASANSANDVGAATDAAIDAATASGIISKTGNPHETQTPQ